MPDVCRGLLVRFLPWTAMSDVCCGLLCPISAAVCNIRCPRSAMSDFCRGLQYPMPAVDVRAISYVCRVRAGGGVGGRRCVCVCWRGPPTSPLTRWSARADRVLRRLVTLISKQASLEASNEAAMRQAVSASNAAQKVSDPPPCTRQGGPLRQRACVYEYHHLLSSRIIVFWRFYDVQWWFVALLRTSTATVFACRCPDDSYRGRSPKWSFHVRRLSCGLSMCC